ncbi:hypothetical protein ONZ45_g17555 [Pleurotus djamor]|nr:hypothetical protein ONZ45_g17555 [Pleurotus djamor]
MPRILPRLIKLLTDSSFALNHANETPIWTHRPSPKTRKNKRKSLYRVVPPRPSYDASKHERSILLEEGNPITNKNDYVGHKMMPPKVRATGTLGKGKEKEKEQCKEGDGEAEEEQWEKVREMTDEERGWWSNPYLRMLASPLRKCIFTDRYLPSDFMIRLAPMKIPAHRHDNMNVPEQQKSKLESKLPMDGPSRIIPVPDGLEHPRFKIRRSGSAAYITCWNDAIPQLFLRGRHKRMNPKLLPHPNLSQHIEHLLRVRILQEFCLFSERLRANPRDHIGTPMAVRRLTRSEWNFIKTTKSIPWEGSVAVIVVPPLNRDPTTGERPKPLMSPPVESIILTASHPSSPATSLSPSAFSSPSSPSSPPTSSPSLSSPSHSLSSSSSSSHTPAPAIAGNSSTSRNSTDRREATEGGEEGHLKGERDATSKPPPPPMSILYPVSPSDSHPALTFTSKNEGEEERDISSPQAHIPLYNGISLFPNREQRAALYGYLTSALKAETRRRGQRGSGAVIGNGEGEGGKGEARKKVRGNDDTTQEKGKGKDKASHAFLLVSNGETSKRADVAAVAIALWRLRMFNGAGWESENTDHWVGKESRKRPE